MKLILNAFVEREREGDFYASLCPEFDVASQGESRAAALANLKEALELFLEEANPATLKKRLTSDMTEMLTDWDALNLKDEIEASRQRVKTDIEPIAQTGAIASG